MYAARAPELEAPRARPRTIPSVGGPESGTREPPAVASLLRMQRSAGNAAVCARIADMKSEGGEVTGHSDEIVDARTSPLQRNGDGTTTTVEPPKTEPVKADAGAPSVLAVTVPPHVRAPSSPAGMADRIPPRVNTAVHVAVGGLKSGDAPVELSIEGGGSGNGTATIDGGATKSISAGADVNLQGVAQTDPGKGGSLKLVAKQGGSQVAASGGFSVSAIPQNYSDTFVSLVTGPKRGFVVQDGWESDSGVFGDLDQTEIAEQVEATSATGCFSGVSKSNSGYLAGNKLSKDTHGTPASICTKPGNRVATQTCMFKDKRAGSADIPMTNSGYSLVRDVRAKGSGGFEIQTTKNGAAVTANGVASGAGAGSIDKTQDV